ncbi:Gustatory and pheromone receptor 32a [Formica fusca]
MKLFARPKCFTEAIAPVITLNRLMGLRVFEYPPGQSRPIFSLIYLLFLYCLYYIGSLHWAEEYYMDVRLLKLEYFLYKILDNIIIYLILVKLLLGWWYTKRFDACYKHIFEIDETLRQLGTTVNYDRIYFITIGIMITWFTFNFCTCIVVFIVMRIHTDTYVTIGTIMVYSYALAVNSINIFDFYIFVKYLLMRFDLINQLLREHSMLSTRNIKLGFFEMQDYTKIIDVEQRCSLPMKMLSQWCRQMQSRKNISLSKKQKLVKSQIQSDFPSHLQKQFQGKLRNRSQKQNSVITECQKRKYLLQIIKQVHLQLCKVSKTVCTILGVQTALEIGIIIMFLTGSLYNLYIRYIARQHKITDSVLQQTAVTIILNSFHLLKIMFLSRVCKQAADKGNKTIEIIYSIYGCDTESGVQEEIQQFGIQILQSPVRFTAYGISLDNHVLTMILKTVTTYLVIMIQVSNSLESQAIQNA